MSVPDELKRREDRLAWMTVAKAKIAARAEERYARERAAYDEKMANRAARAQVTGKKAGGKEPVAPQPGAQPQDQINLTDEDSRIMPVAGGDFEQACNAQAGVDAATMLVVGTVVTQAANDKEQVVPMLETLETQAVTEGQLQCLIADSGYYSADNVHACEAAEVEPLIAVARKIHHPGWRERRTEPAPLSGQVTPAQAMAHRLKTKDGGQRYALRKQTVEPVSASSNPSWDFVNFLYAVWTMFAGSGAWSAWPGI